MPNYRDTAKDNGSQVTSRIPVITTEHINDFTTTGLVQTIDNEAGNITNGVVDRYAGETDRFYVTDRPLTTTYTVPADGTAVSAKGRGVHVWSSNNKTYIVNDVTVYENTYATAITGNLSASSARRVYFAEWSSAAADYLFIIDPSQGRGYYINSVEVPLTLHEMTGTGSTVTALDAYDFTNFPSDATTGVAMSDGAVVLDNYLFVANQDGKIYNNSTVDNFLQWPVANIVTAERQNDILSAIVLSKDHLVALGSQSIELFYDAANVSPASPLSARTDIFYTNGLSSGTTGTYIGEGFWQAGDDIYFISNTSSGDFSLSALKNFELVSVSTSTVNSFLRGVSTFSQGDYTLGGFSSGGHTYVLATMYDNPIVTGGVPILTLVYDAGVSAWYVWNTPVASITTSYPVKDNTSVVKSNITAGMQLILTNGDVIYIDDRLDGLQVGFTVILDNIEFDTTNRKFMHSLAYVGSLVDPAVAATMEISWSDDNGTNWNTPIEIDLAVGEQLNRLGSFGRRKFKVANTSVQKLRMEALEVTYTKGNS